MQRRSRISNSAAQSWGRGKTLSALRGMILRDTLRRTTPQTAWFLSVLVVFRMTSLSDWRRNTSPSYLRLKQLRLPRKSSLTSLAARFASGTTLHRSGHSGYCWQLGSHNGQLTVSRQQAQYVRAPESVGEQLHELLHELFRHWVSHVVIRKRT